MSLIRLNLTPAPRDLRVFSTLWLVFLGAFGALAWHQGAHRVAFTLWAAGGIGGVAGLIFPPAMRYVYLGSVYVTFPIGFVSSYVILGAVYYLVLTPIGLIMRLLRHDPLTRRFEPERKTYWQPRGQPRPAHRYFRQH